MWLIVWGFATFCVVTTSLVGHLVWRGKDINSHPDASVLHTLKLASSVLILILFGMWVLTTLIVIGTLS